MPVIDLGSVVGPQGPQGATGATGAQGLQGNPGPNQVTNQTSTNLIGVLQGASSKVSVKPVDSTPTANSTNLVSSGGVKTALDAKANPSQIAYVESGTTASRAYAVGESFCRNGLLYRVKAAIPSGGTFTPGTNCEQKTVTTLPGRELVWSNPNPNSSFPDGTISVDLSRFTAIHIIFKATANDSSVSDAHLKIDDATHSVSILTMPPSGTASVGLSRTFAPSSTGIVCGSGLVKTLLNGTRETDNERIVPQRIYGVY